MKNFLRVFIFIAFPLVMMAGGPGDDIIKAFKQNDVASIATYFDSNIDLNVDGKDNTYSKSQALQILNSFFSKNKVSEVKILHEVTSPNNACQSIVAQMISGTNKFRINIVIDKTSDKVIIQEITIRNR